ncbi:hypothetical protein IG631_23087 [Alternaria alternata]|nr:hypothetical protein IG631_23087 [Alternaria alternata]
MEVYQTPDFPSLTPPQKHTSLTSGAGCRPSAYTHLTSLATAPPRHTQPAAADLRSRSFIRHPLLLDISQASYCSAATGLVTKLPASQKAKSKL